jgi:hypothetical protein
MTGYAVTDIVIGGKYLTWGGKILIVTSIRAGEFWWRDEEGKIGSTRAKSFISRIRKEIKG